jgi:hypothetical protein
MRWQKENKHTCRRPARNDAVNEAQVDDGWRVVRLSARFYVTSAESCNQPRKPKPRLQRGSLWHSWKLTAPCAT